MQVEHLCLVRIGGTTTLEHLHDTSVLHGHTGSRQGMRMHTVNDIGIAQHHTHRHLIDTNVAGKAKSSAARLGWQASPSLPPSHGRSDLVVLGDKPQRDAVVAPALPGGRGAIVEHVAVVAAAAHAMIFCAWPDQFKIPLGANASGMVVKKLGQPVPLSNFIAEVNSGRLQPAQTNTPGRFSSLSGLVRSVRCLPGAVRHIAGA